MRPILNVAWISSVDIMVWERVTVTLLCYIDFEAMFCFIVERITSYLVLFMLQLDTLLLLRFAATGSSV